MTSIARNGISNEIYPIFQCASHQELRIHEPGVIHVLLGQKTAPIDIFVDLLRLGDVGDVRRVRVHPRGEARSKNPGFLFAGCRKGRLR